MLTHISGRYSLLPPLSPVLGGEGRKRGRPGQYNLLQKQWPGKRRPPRRDTAAGREGQDREADKMVTQEVATPAGTPPGIHELTEDVSASPYYNPDLAPTRWRDRKWGLKDMAALWIALSACIPTYMLASALIEEGMNWWQ